MNERHDEFERLASAFATRRQSRGRDECPDAEQIFEAAAGNLSRDQRMTVLGHVAKCAECTQAWRLAMESGARPAAPAAEPIAATSTSTRPLRAAWMPLRQVALVASVVLAVGVTAYLGLPVSDETSGYRDAAVPLAPVSLAPDSLPRDRFVLKWSPGPQGSSYSVRLSTTELNLLLVQQNLMSPELTVPAEALTQVNSGDRLLWQVEVRLPSGQQIPSETYVVTLR